MPETQRHEIDETRCDQLEAAWLSGKATPLERLLPPVDDARYLPTLERLVTLEMELAWERRQVTLPADTPATPPSRIEDYLARFPVLEEREIVLRLCQQEYRLRQACGENPSAEEYLNRFAKYLENEEQVTCAATSAPLPAQGQATAAASSSKLQEGQKLDQFRLVAPYAQGGFGAVWHAEDETLNRPVALKTLRGIAAEDAISRRRFVSEARVTARLEHPGIVPVHQAGRLRETDPYYTMKLVQGETLAEAIRSYHKENVSGESRHGLAWRRLLEAVLAVCRTMEYAHAQGVLHRDLKPQNIVLGEYGETILLDWGLAKDLFAAAPDDSTYDLDTAGYEKAHVTHPELVTRDGAVQGTPAYMAPEQAAGQVDQIDRRSDIYAIGAMLYQVLAGRLPFEGDSAERILEQVREHTPPAPGQIAEGVPPALEAICQKAMARQREDRYTEMRLLREDLESYLAGEPVSCYREPLSARAGRWVWQHRTLTASVVVAGVVTMIALAGLAALQAASRAKVAQANEKLEQAVATANETNQQLEIAQANLETQFETLAQKNAELTAANELIVSQQDGGIEMVEAMLAQYHALLAARMKDLAVETDLQPEGGIAQGAAGAEGHLGPFSKEALARLGYLLDRQGRYDECQDIYRTLISAYAYLHETFPDSLAYEENLAQAYYAAGFISDTTGRFDEAATHYARSLTHFENLHQREPGNANHRAQMANVWHNRGLLNRHRDNWDAAKADYEQALAALEPLVEKYPNRWAFRGELAATQANLGALYHRQGEQQAALAVLEQALANRSQLVEQYPQAQFQRYGRAGVLLTLASVQWSLGHSDDALELYEFAAREIDAVLEQDPTNNQYALDAGKAYMGLAQVVANDRLDTPTARQWLQRAIDRFEAILARSPQHAEAAEMAFTANIYLAQACMELKEWEDASWAWYRVDELNPGQDVTMYRYQYNLTRILAGNYAHTDEAAEALLEDTEQPEMFLRYNAAVLYAAASQSALADSEATAEEAVRESERMAREALLQLSVGRELGLFEEPQFREQLQSDPLLEPLRSRTDFRDLQRLLEAEYGETSPAEP